MLPPLTIAVLLLTPPGTPAGGFHWQRIITPPPGAPTQQACVVLDAATFANAAPALRDLRLFQDGTELPYVVEESYDERALNSGVTSDDDRSEYEAVYTGVMQPRPSSGVAGQAAPATATGTGYYASTSVGAHVPIERIRLDPAPASPVHLILSALPSGARDPFSRELDQHTLDVNHPAWAFTLGADLQHQAQVTIVDDTPGLRSERVILEMRKRSLCYQPRSAAPLVLYLGGGEGMSAKVYGMSNGFSVAANRPYATMGPLEPNPDLDHPARRPISRLLIAIAVLGTALLITLWVALEFMRKDTQKQRGRPEAAHS